MTHPQTPTPPAGEPSPSAWAMEEARRVLGDRCADIVHHKNEPGQWPTVLADVVARALDAARQSVLVPVEPEEPDVETVARWLHSEHGDLFTFDGRPLAYETISEPYRRMFARLARAILARYGPPPATPPVDKGER